MEPEPQPTPGCSGGPAGRTLHEKQGGQDGGCQQSPHSRPVRPVHPPGQPARLLPLRPQRVEAVAHTGVCGRARLVLVQVRNV